MLFNSFQVLGGKASAVAFDSRGRQQLARFPMKKKSEPKLKTFSEIGKNIYVRILKFVMFALSARSELLEKQFQSGVANFIRNVGKKNNSQLSPPMRLSRNSII